MTVMKISLPFSTKKYSVFVKSKLFSAFILIVAIVVILAVTQSKSVKDFFYWISSYDSDVTRLKIPNKQLVKDIAIDREGNSIAVYDSSNRLHIWNAKNFEFIKTSSKITDEISDIDFFDNVQIIISTSTGLLMLWNFETGEYNKILKFPSSEILSLQSIENEKIVVFSQREQKRKSAIPKRSFQVIDISDKSIDCSGYLNKIDKNLYVLPNSKKMAVIDVLGTITIWNIDSCTVDKTFTNKYATEQQIGKLHPPTFISTNVDASKILSPAGDSILVRDTHSGNSEVLLKIHSKEVLGAVFGVNERYIVSSSKGDSLKIWDSEKKKVVKKLSFNSDSLQKLSRIPNSENFVTVGSQNIFLWNLSTSTP